MNIKKLKLEQKVQSLDEEIENWVPPTAWDAANQRDLKYLKRIRTKKANAAERVEQEEKKRRLKERRAKHEFGQSDG